MTISRPAHLVATLALFCAASCSDDPAFFGVFDVNPDAAQGDVGEQGDGGTSDVEPSDTDTPDTGTADVGTPDTGTTDTGTPDTGPTCGNDARDPGELCDGTDLGGSTCQSFAFTGGTLRCGDDCLSYDFSGCTGGGDDPVCGNGAREAGEVCDGDDVAGANCQGFGFDRGTLTCLGTCQGYDFSACENDVCVPDCSGRSCGADPICGDSCGTCSEGQNCNAAGQCVAASGGPPRFITFDSNVRRITDGQSVRFTTVVTDPDGIDDLIGGTLRDPVSGSTYGSFSTSAAEGSYQIELSWADIHFVRPIELVDNEARVFEAEFFDTAANRVTRDITVELFCDGGNAGATCDGSCVRVDTTSRCGGCDLSCGASNVCAPAGASFACECGEAFALCGGECVDRFDEASCGDGCETCSSGEFCDVSGCSDAINEIRVTEDDILQVLHRGDWRSVCDDSFDAFDAEVACRQLGGSLLEFENGAGGPTELFWLDDLRCTGDESRLADCPNNGWGNENCGAGESVRLVCSNTGTICNDPTAAAYISEVLYDAVGTDTGLEYIELFSFDAVSFGGTTIELLNADGSTYAEIELPPTALIPGGADRWYLLGQADVAGADALFTPAIQNGPDAMVWRGCDGGIIDAVQYGDAPALFPAEAGAPAVDVFGGASLSRFLTGGDNSLDFAAGVQTPGAANEPLEPAGGDYSETFELTLGSSTFTRPEEPCAAGGEAGFRYASRTLTNPGRTLSVTVRAEHSALFDGYLFAYLGSFNPASPTANCENGDDDEGNTTASELTLVWPSGQDLIVVTSSYNSGDTGSSTVTVTEIVAE